MLYVNKNDVNLFDTVVQTITSNGVICMLNNQYDSKVSKQFSSNEKEIWVSYQLWCINNSQFSTCFKIYLDNGNFSWINHQVTKSQVWLPNKSDGGQTSIAIKNNNITERNWTTIRYHIWIDKDNPTVLHLSAYNNGKIMLEDVTSTITDGAKFSYINEVQFLKSYPYEVDIANVIICDKFFGESAKIKSIPITQVKNWTKDPDTEKYYASKVNQKGTLVIDPLLLSDLEKYNVISTALSGKMNRQGDNIKNIELTVGEEKINQEIAYGNNGLSIDIGNDLTALSNVTIETKG